MPSDSPHLLELDANLVEGFGDDRYEDVLDEPSQEEDHCAEIKHRSPSGQGIYGSVHDEDPSFLRGCLVDREEAGD